MGVEAALVSTPRWRLGAGLGTGLVGFLRATTALLPQVDPAPPRLTPAAYVAPEFSARWRGGAVALEASLALDVLAGAPTFVYQSVEGVVVRNQLWLLQPRVGVAMLLDLK